MSGRHEITRTARATLTFANANGTPASEKMVNVIAGAIGIEDGECLSVMSAKYDCGVTAEQLDALAEGPIVCGWGSVSMA